MSGSDDLAAAGHALDALARAVSALGPHYAESLDLHRLREDVARVGVDLELLRESTPPAPDAPPVPATVGEAGYDPAFLVDGVEEGVPPRP